MTTGAELKQLGADLIVESDRQRDNAGEYIADAIQALIAKGRDFTAEDVRDQLRDKPAVLAVMAERPNLLSAHFAGASRSGDIRPVGFTIPARASRHGSVIRVWRAAA